MIARIIRTLIKTIIHNINRINRNNNSISNIHHKSINNNRNNNTRMCFKNRKDRIRLCYNIVNHKSNNLR